jgi:hemerythrin superfamily protein
MAMNKSHVPAAQKGVLGMLIDDHREAQKLFKDFKSAKEDSRKDEIVRHACTALTAHTKIEEEHFYPYLRDADPEAFGSLLDEAKVEHASAKDLIAQLQAMKPGDALYEAHFTVLGEYTNHHITEEEDELFKKVIDKDIDLRTLEKPMEETKRQVLSAKAPA